MQVTQTLAEGLKREFKVVVPAGDLASRVDAQLAEMKDKVRINGFRPGKVPVAHLKRAVTVHGAEHFFPRYNNLTCSASPVFAPDGALCGILDASSDCVSRQAHTQALVAMAATQIENGLFREQHRGNIIVAFHNRGEYLHTLSAGLLATDRDEGR